MSVTPHANSTNTVHAPANAATVTITKPTVSAGDILVCTFGLNLGTSIGTANVSAPAGWTQIGATISNSKAAVQVWWALQSVAALGFTYNIGSALGTADLSWVCESFSGVDNTTPINATGTGNSNTAANSISVATFNTVTDLALELIAAVDFNGGSVFTSTGFTVLPSSTANCQLALLYANSAVTPAGATGAKTLNDSAAASGNILCYQQFALQPASSAAAFPPRPLIAVHEFFRPHYED